MEYDKRIKERLDFVAERIRRGTYSPEDVRMRLMGLKIDKKDYERLMEAAANNMKARETSLSFRPTPMPVSEKPKPENYAIIAFSTVPEYDSEGRPWHTYWGGNHFNRRFVKSFSGKDIEFTKEEKEAYKFTDDHICDACMAKLIMEHHAFSIALWEEGSKMLHYPGEHWSRNDHLIPSFINRKGVNDFDKEGIIFDRRRGWHKKEA